jgi:D-alanine-D-alanine ligase
MTKTRIAVLFGGRSPEHWISFKSGVFVLLHLDRRAYEVEAVYVRPDGGFASAAEFLATLERFLTENQVVLFRDEASLGDWRSLLKSTATVLSATFLAAASRGAWDFLFPVFHGRFGEDGTVQGLAEFLGLPYAGCDFQGSALGMDKILTKKIAASRGLAVAPYRELHRDQWQAADPADLAADLAGDLGWPMFVKPSRLGSSIGVGRATEPVSLARTLTAAFEYDYRVLVESEIRGTEYAVGVLGDGTTTRTSVVAEYTSQPENFDYDSKYGPQSLPDIIPSHLSPADTMTLLEFSKKVFGALKMRGISRVDSFWGPQGPVLNEVNTMPGLNPNSPFILAWEKTGLTERALLSQIVELGMGKPWVSSGS